MGHILYKLCHSYVRSESKEVRYSNHLCCRIRLCYGSKLFILPINMCKYDN